MGVANVRTGRSKHAKPKPPPRFKSPLDKAKAHEVIWNQVAPLFEAARGIENPHFVYVIGEPDGGMVKIGTSKEPISRLRTMQTGNPRRLKIEHVLVGSPDTEKLLQEMWLEYAIRGVGRTTVNILPGTEWFDAACRPLLEPIMVTAAANQVDLILDPGREFSWRSLEAAIRQAHGEHGFVAHKRHVGEFLTVDGGSRYSHRSYI